MRVLLLLALLCASALARRENLNLQNERRPYFIISSFGLLQGGSITVSLQKVSQRFEVADFGQVCLLASVKTPDSCIPHSHPLDHR
jgi:hypothetical protein